ncbi:MAG TPA: Type 1 glutamine amidotransferase-like domain-containing protein [Gemmatimonadaceae bacterium]|nr:Type 1 glutamine amidotransferase-like domain-containing protein [Gemmatimonadaceae bacterium]
MSLRIHSSLITAIALSIAPAYLVAQSAPKVGPPRGTVIVVGGGSIGPEIYQRFIDAAGGPNALIIDVPTAGGDSVYKKDAIGALGLKQTGAKNVYALHTIDRSLADADSFAALLRKATGGWFEGGRQFHLVDSYAETKTEQGFHDVLARGGVVGGSSAGASIIGSFLVRGAPSNNNLIMDWPGYEKGFGFLRGVGIDQHVVARERLADLADSIMPKYPDLLGISEDEGTAWVVNGDVAEIVGRNKAFVYGGKDAADAGKPFLTLHPGDKYDLATRHVVHRAIDDSPVSIAFVDSLFKKYSDPSLGGATVLVAQAGEVFIDKSYGIPDQAKFMPTTTVPQFQLGAMAEVFSSICSQLPEAPAARGNRGGDSTGRRGQRGGAGAAASTSTPFQTCVGSRVSAPVGMHKTNATADGQVHSNVDELYRLALGLENPRTFGRDTTSGDSSGAGRSFDSARGWQADSYHGVSRLGAFALPGGMRSAFIRIPEKRASIIILTGDDAAAAKALADRITDQLLMAKKR